MKSIARFSTAVLACLTLLAAVSAAQNPVRLKVTAELANIRLKPSIGSVIIRQIPQGRILESTGKEGEWYHVKLEPDDRGNTSGYVHESLVLPIEETIPPVRKSQPAEPVVKPPVDTGAPPVIIQQDTGRPAGSQGWAVAITAGGQYTFGGDLNKGPQAFSDFFAQTSGAAGDAEVDPVHLSFVFGGEFSAEIVPGFSFVMGADFYSASRTSEVNYIHSGLTDTYTTKPHFQAIPIRVGFALSPVREFSLKAGVSYTIARCSYFYRYEMEQGGFWQEWTGEATGGGLGAWASLALELPLSENLAFVVEAGGHYAPLTGFEGTGTKSDANTDTPIEEKGKLWAYDYVEAGKTITPLLLIRTQKPTDAYVENAREAAIDFSGVSLKAGIKVRF